MPRVAKRSPFAIFDVLVEHLIAANLIFPDLRLEVLKVFIVVDIEPFLVGVVTAKLNDVFTFALEANAGILELFALEQVQVF